jgi:transposase
MSARAAAARFGIGISTAISRISSARRGQLTPDRQGRPGSSRLDAHDAFIIGMIEASKNITLDEMVARLADERGVKIGRSRSMSGRAGTAGLLKKDRPRTGAGTGRPFETASGMV